MTFVMEPIGVIRAARTEPEDDHWGGTTADIVLAAGMDPTCLDGIEDFSHAEILYVFDRVRPEKIVMGSRHPRNNTAWPKVGIFAQRGKNRPNRIGSTIVRIVGRTEGGGLRVAELDAIDGTPVIDIKPVMQELLPRTPVHQPAWSSELMTEYWR
jgi:tRNA-Thr(GGU) m(6)t(6)A37 methyltransferase TsaA